MSQRPSGYDREAFDKYQTPAWVTQALVPHIPAGVELVLEPACGDGHMVQALRSAGYAVIANDIQSGEDFLTLTPKKWPIKLDAIVTNPPYDCGQEFCERAVNAIDHGYCTFVAMLLRIDFDSAKTRRHLFADNLHFTKKIVLLDRIRWEGIQQHTSSPSYNHCWLCWDAAHSGPATIAYAKKAAIIQQTDMFVEEAA